MRKIHYTTGPSGLTVTLDPSINLDPERDILVLHQGALPDSLKPPEPAEQNRDGNGAAASDSVITATPSQIEPTGPDDPEGDTLRVSPQAQTQPQATGAAEPPELPSASCLPPSPPRTRTRAEAARENGRKSRGPKTPEGKARSSRNALKHGLTARFVTINSEEDEEWESFLAACREELQPVGVIELSYADEFASSRWRLRRCLGIETVIFDDEFAHQETDIKKYKLIDDVGRTGLAFKKIKEDLNALGRYETRIRRAGERALANLLKLKQLRENEPNDPQRDPEEDSSEASAAGPLHSSPDPEGDTLRVSPPAQDPHETPCSTHELVAAEPRPATQQSDAKRTQATGHNPAVPLHSAFGILHSS